MSKRLKKSICIPVILTGYTAALAYIYAKDWIVAGHVWRLILSLTFQLVIIVCVAVFLRKRERL